MCYSVTVVIVYCAVRCSLYIIFVCGILPLQSFFGACPVVITGYLFRDQLM